MRITIDDCRRYYCCWGIRGWFRRHGLDFRRFLDEGIDAEEFVAKGDWRAQQVVEAKRAAQEADHGRE